MANIDGTCDERFGPVRDAFAANFDRGLDVGASVSVVLDGQTVVDLWGGSIDGTPDAPRPNALAARHHHQRVVHHQDHDRPVRPDAGRPGGAGPVTPRWPATGPSSRPAARSR